MTTWNVKSFPTGTVSADGMEITIEVDLGAGRKGKLNLPFSQLDWLQQALLSLSQGAYDRQVATGRLAPSANAVEGQSAKAEALRVMADTQKKEILVQMNVRVDPSAPQGMASFLIESDLATHLATRLRECVEQIVQAAHPS